MEVTAQINTEKIRGFDALLLEDKGCGLIVGQGGTLYGFSFSQTSEPRVTFEQSIA